MTSPWSMEFIPVHLVEVPESQLILIDAVDYLRNSNAFDNVYIDDATDIIIEIYGVSAKVNPVGDFYRIEDLDIIIMKIQEAKQKV